MATLAVTLSGAHICRRDAGMCVCECAPRVRVSHSSNDRQSGRFVVCYGPEKAGNGRAEQTCHESKQEMTRQEKRTLWHRCRL